MNLTESFFNWGNKVSTNLSEMSMQPIYSYCKLQTTMGDSTLVADDGSLISIYELHGSLGLYGTEELIDQVELLEGRIGARMAKAGHCIQVLMHYDPEMASDEIKALFSPSRITLKNLGIDISPVMDDWEQAISKFCSSEHVLIVAWTRPCALTGPDLAKGKQGMKKNFLANPSGSLVQNVGQIMLELEEIHDGFNSLLESAFEQSGMITDRLNNHDALWWARHSIDPDFTQRTWKARIPGDKLPLMLSDTIADDNYSELFSYPSFEQQLFPRQAEHISATTIRIGDRIHAPLSLELAPLNPQPFNVLFRDLISKNIPFRASFMFEGGNIPQLMFLKKQIAKGFSWLSSVNKMYASSVEELEKRQLNGTANVKFSGSFDTWVFDDDTPECTRILKKRRSDLVSAVQAWGTCDCSETTGEPLLGVMATVPAMMPTSPAPKTMPPLGDVLFMMPFTRMASVWREGSLILRTPDGKIMPYEIGSSKQTAWLDGGCGGMGSGKSAWLNTLNWAYITQPNLPGLPFLTIIDIGRSSRGVIRLLQSVLPPDQKHAAKSFIMRMDPDMSINPCDLPLGCQVPLDRHLSFLVNLCCLFATPLGDKAPPAGVPGLARKAIMAAYENLSDDRNPKLYRSRVNLEIDALVESMNIPIDEGSTWREISRYLFDKGLYHEAGLAQRYAEPLISDIAAAVKENRVSDLYKDEKTTFGMPVPDYFWRSLIEAIDAYPVLKDYTRFYIGDETRVVSIDLEDVAPKGGEDAKRQTAVMMMLARHAGASRFFMKPEDVKYVPDHFKPYQEKRLQELSRLPARICYDEIHRYDPDDDSITSQFVADLMTAARESRKWALHIGLYSQFITDFPKAILDLITSFFVMGAPGTNESLEFLKKTFGLNESAKNAVKNLRKPNAKGATMFCIFKTDAGTAWQLLTSTLGQQVLWAFSSTREDSNVRDPLYEKIGIKKTLQLLAAKYPGGLKPILDKRRRMVTEKTELELADDLVEDVISEILLLAD